MVASQIVLAAGIGAVSTIATDLVLATVPADRAGAAAAVSETAIEFGAAMGIAVLGTIGTVIYRATLAESGLPSEILATAQESVGGAYALGARLPDGLLITAAGQAFVGGMQWVSWIGAAGCLVLAGFVLVVLGRILPAQASSGVSDHQFGGQNQ